MKSIKVLNAIVKPFLGIFKLSVYKKPLVFWLSKRLLSSEDRIELLYLNFTNGLPKHLLVKNSQLSTLSSSLAVIRSNGANKNLFEKFLENYFANAEKFESQFLQDCFVDTFFKNKTNGVFIEIGVGQGKRISNTYFLEKFRGWQGLLCEPSLRYHESIQNSRTANLIKNAVTNKPGETIRFAEVIGDGEQSTLVQYLDADGHNRGNYKEYDVTTITLEEVIDINLPDKKVDYMSVDTEGSELSVLKGINFNLVDIKCISIEHNHEMDKLNQIRTLLFKYDYAEIGMGTFSDDVFFIKKGLMDN